MAQAEVLLDTPTQEKMGSKAEEDKKENKIKGYAQWTPAQVGDYFATCGPEYDQYRDIWAAHNITGERLVMMQPADVKLLKIDVIGHRMGIVKELEVMKLEARKQMREMVVAKRIEAFDGSCIGEQISTCCGIFPRDPDKYTLMASALKIEEFEVPRLCGIWKCTCCGGKRSVDNVSLEMVRDVDTVKISSGLCCCKVDKCKILLATGAGTEAGSEASRIVMKQMFVEGEEGEAFADEITIAVEDYQSLFKTYQT